MSAIISVALFVVFILVSQGALAKYFGAKICQSSPDYSCYVVKRGETWANLFPDEVQRDVVMRINRTNMSLSAGQTIAVPHDHRSDPLQHSPFSQTISPPGTKLVMVSLSDLAFGAYDEHGSLVHWGPISGGRNYCADVGRGCRTPAGKFQIYTKKGAGCVSSKYPVGKGGAPMPYCMFFNGGYALHGSPKVPGYNDSHGCVRLFTNDAKWLNQEFMDGYSGVAVYIER